MPPIKRSPAPNEKIVKQYELSIERINFIEHYEGAAGGAHPLQSVDFRAEADRFADPRWTRISHDEFEALTGYRLSWRAAESDEGRSL